MRIKEEDCISEPEGFTLANYVKSNIEMFEGDIQEVELICDNEIMKNVIDKFGENIETEREE